MRFQMPAAVFLVLEKDGEILLQRRYNTGYRDGQYDLPAGHIEENETAQEALVREAKEETGIDIKIADLKVLHVLHNHSDSAGYIDIFLTTEKWDGEPSNMEPHKCDDMRWFSKDSLPEVMTPHVRSALEHIKKGVFYSNHGRDK